MLKPTSLVEAGGTAEIISGASSSRTWAFVPPNPNEFTPALAGPSCSGHPSGRLGIS